MPEMLELQHLLTQQTPAGPQEPSCCPWHAFPPPRGKRGLCLSCPCWQLHNPTALLSGHWHLWVACAGVTDLTGGWQRAQLSEDISLAHSICIPGNKMQRREILAVTAQAGFVGLSITKITEQDGPKSLHCLVPLTATAICSPARRYQSDCASRQLVLGSSWDFTLGTGGAHGPCHAWEKLHRRWLYSI